MSDDAKNSMLLYRGLSAKEREKLEPMENDIVRLLHNKLGGVVPRIWTSRTDNGERFIRLCFADPQSTVLMEISANEFVDISQAALLSRLQQSCELQRPLEP